MLALGPACKAKGDDPGVAGAADGGSVDGGSSDCGGTIDGPDALDADTWHMDADADGFGDPDTTERSCDPAVDFVSDGTDCDDDDAAVNPAATETCNDVDDDCDALVDDEHGDLDTSTAHAWCTDADGDG